jgi:ferric-dicitrate binding protein FerR (iron transport regulator)
MKASKPLDWDALRNDVAEGERGVASWDDERARARARLLATVQGRSPRRSDKRLPAVLAALALAASLALGFVGWQRYRAQPSITFDTGSEHVSGRVGALLTAPDAETLPVHFSDGTLVTMSSATVARVTETSSRGANIVLDDGSLSLAVVHRDTSSWHVAAGPFTVLVTGTKFDVRWSAPDATLTLDLHEGSVTVTGPTLGPQGRRVLPGESLRVAIAEPPDPAPPDTDGELEAPHAPREEAAKGAPSESTVKSGSSWKQLAEQGQFADAFAAAQAEGFDAVCRRASAGDLLLLGDSARFAGSPSRAEQALRLARTRAAGSHEAAMAAFALGRLASNEQHNFGAASRWFQTYLREEPNGRLAREASGRLIEAQRAAGDMAGARATATAYLAKYPAGPHAGLARSVLNP